MAAQSPPSFMDLLGLQNSLQVEFYRKHGLSASTASPVLEGLASGLDTALTIIDSSAVSFQGLPQETAKKIHDYFNSEANRYAETNAEISAWYASWAKAIAILFIGTEDR